MGCLGSRGLRLVGIAGLVGIGCWFVGFVWIDGWRAEGGLLGFGLAGWLGWVLGGRRRPGFKCTLERRGLVVEETEAGGVTGGEPGQMSVGKFLVVIESGSDLTRGSLLRGFTFPDGSLDA